MNNPVLWEDFIMDVLTEINKPTKILFSESFQCYTGRESKLLNVPEDFLSPYSRWKFPHFSFRQTEVSKDLCSYGYSNPLVAIQYGYCLLICQFIG